MKKYIIKKYKGNLLESISRFQKLIKNFNIKRVYEATDKNSLYIEGTGGLLDPSRPQFRKGKQLNNPPEYMFLIENGPDGHGEALFSIKQKGITFVLVPAGNEKSYVWKLRQLSQALNQSIRPDAVHASVEPSYTTDSEIAKKWATELSERLKNQLVKNKVYLTLRAKTYHSAEQRNPNRRTRHQSANTLKFISYFNGYSWSPSLDSVLKQKADSNSTGNRPEIGIPDETLLVQLLAKLMHIKRNLRTDAYPNLDKTNQNINKFENEIDEIIADCKELHDLQQSSNDISSMKISIPDWIMTLKDSRFDRFIQNNKENLKTFLNFNETL